MTRTAFLLLAACFLLGGVSCYIYTKWHPLPSQQHVEIMETKNVDPLAIPDLAAGNRVELMLARAAKKSPDLAAKVVDKSISETFKPASMLFICEAAGYFYGQNGLDWCVKNYSRNQGLNKSFNVALLGWYYATPDKLYEYLNTKPGSAALITTETLRPLAIDYEHTQGANAIKTWPGKFSNASMKELAWLISLDEIMDRDQTQAFQWFSEEPSLNASSKIREAFVKRIVQQVPEAGLVWFGKTPTFALSKQMQLAIMKQWALVDVKSANNWLQLQFFNGTDVDNLITAFIEGCGGTKDWKQARAWAVKIKDETTRNTSLLTLALALVKTHPLEAKHLVSSNLFSKELLKKYNDTLRKKNGTANVDSK